MNIGIHGAVLCETTTSFTQAKQTGVTVCNGVAAVTGCSMS